MVELEFGCRADLVLITLLLKHLALFLYKICKTDGKSREGKFSKELRMEILKSGD